MFPVHPSKLNSAPHPPEDRLCLPHSVLCAPRGPWGLSHELPEYGHCVWRCEVGWGLSLEEPEVTDASASASRRVTREMLREARGKLRPGQGPWSRQTGRQVSTGDDGRFLLEVSTARALPTTPLISAQAFPKQCPPSPAHPGLQVTCRSALGGIGVGRLIWAGGCWLLHWPAGKRPGLRGPSKVRVTLSNKNRAERTKVECAVQFL